MLTRSIEGFESDICVCTSMPPRLVHRLKTKINVALPGLRLVSGSDRIPLEMTITNAMEE